MGHDDITTAELYQIKLTILAVISNLTQHKRSSTRQLVLLVQINGHIKLSIQINPLHMSPRRPRIAL